MVVYKVVDVHYYLISLKSYWKYFYPYFYKLYLQPGTNTNMLWNSMVAKQTMEAEINFVSESKYWANLYFRYMNFCSVSPSAPSLAWGW